MGTVSRTVVLTYSINVTVYRFIRTIYNMKLLLLATLVVVHFAYTEGLEHGRRDNIQPEERTCPRGLTKVAGVCIKWNKGRYGRRDNIQAVLNGLEDRLLNYEAGFCFGGCPSGKTCKTGGIHGGGLSSSCQ